VRHRLNVMQGGASVARCSTAHAVLCQESASGARAFARVLREFELNNLLRRRHAYAWGSFSTRKAGNGLKASKSWRWSALVEYDRPRRPPTVHGDGPLSLTPTCPAEHD
jgi:hypothetical protein